MSSNAIKAPVCKCVDFNVHSTVKQDAVCSQACFLHLLLGVEDVNFLFSGHNADHKTNQH